jgi:NADPH2:quinone reductase
LKAIRIHECGGPEVMRLEDARAAEPGPGQVRVQLAAAGVNFIDVYQRTGLYPLSRPFTPGLEGAGEVVALGPEVSDLAPGDRVAWAGVQGSYAQEVIAPAERLVRSPKRVEPRVAAALMLQGMTAQYLVRSTWPLQSGQTCLVHAAAGGVGLLLVQLSRRIGARVVATVSTEEKAELARAAGADRVVLYTREDFEVAAREESDGRGVDVVYDSVGRTTWEKSLRCLGRRGMLVLFGQSSGVVPPIDPRLLASGGSLFLTRPSLFDYIADRASLEARAAEVLGLVERGELEVRIGATWPLAEAAAAHRALEARQTTGKVLLLP